MRFGSHIARHITSMLCVNIQDFSLSSPTKSALTLQRPFYTEGDNERGKILVYRQPIRSARALKMHQGYKRPRFWVSAVTKDGTHKLCNDRWNMTIHWKALDDHLSIQPFYRFNHFRGKIAFSHWKNWFCKNQRESCDPGVKTTITSRVIQEWKLR
jgi:hypothetical protein